MSIKQEILNPEKINGIKTFNPQTESTIYWYDNPQTLLKIVPYHHLNPTIEEEEKIKYADRCSDLKELLKPTSLIYRSSISSTNYMGYTMPYLPTIIPYHEYLKTLSDGKDLYKMAELHTKLETLLEKCSTNKDKAGNSCPIVLPDLLSCGNLQIIPHQSLNSSEQDINKVEYQLIDYDGIQIGPYQTLFQSTDLESFSVGGTKNKEHKYPESKYFNSSNCLFTSNINSLSSIILYFLSTINSRVTRIGEYISFEEYFDMTGIDDYDIQDKIWTLYQPKDNEFLGREILENIAETYKVKTLGRVKDLEIRKFERK